MRLWQQRSIDLELLAVRDVENRLESVPKTLLENIENDFASTE